MAGDRTPSAGWVTLDDLERDPHPTLARLRADHPVAWVPALGMWMITSRALALAAMQDFEGLTVDDPRFSTGQVVGPSMLSLDGAEHTRHRAPFVGPFRFGRIDDGFTDAVQGFVGDLLDRAEHTAATAGTVELRTALAAPLATRTMMLALGLDTAAEGTILAWYASIVHAVTEITRGNPIPADGRAAYAGLAAAISAAGTRPGARTLLAEAMGAATALDEIEVAANAAVLLFGGIETTEGMIANLLHHLLTEPGLLAAVRAEPELLGPCIEESLRLEPAAAVVDRYATRDVSIGGVVIPAGDPVTISLAGANRDPATFADPDRFHPGRDALRQHLTFAAGPHVCLGAHLARLETRLLVHGLLQRFAQIDSVAEASDPPRGLVFRKPNRITAHLSRM
ncbi:MAG: cytochrome P450 [Actinomycetota bacterium]